MINAARMEGKINGFQVSPGGLLVTHLQYADDTILFCKDETDDIRSLKTFLRCFEAPPGLRINFSKTELIGINLDEDCIKLLAEGFGCKVGNLPLTYLGVPLCSGKVLKEWWDLVVEKQLPSRGVNTCLLGTFNLH